MLLLAGLMAGVPAIAAQQKEQHHWYILSFQDGECYAAAVIHPRIATPEQFHNPLRNQGVLDNIRVEKNNDGAVTLVIISYTSLRGEQGGSFWFPGSDQCEFGKIAARISGMLPDTSDLK